MRTAVPHRCLRGLHCGCGRTAVARETRSRVWQVYELVRTQLNWSQLIYFAIVLGLRSIRHQVATWPSAWTSMTQALARSSNAQLTDPGLLTLGLGFFRDGLATPRQEE
jgi:uncharacterized protein YjeT (DUF2065 family)